MFLSILQAVEPGEPLRPPWPAAMLADERAADRAMIRLLQLELQLLWEDV
jgi:hypothetical protein